MDRIQNTAQNLGWLTSSKDENFKQDFLLFGNVSAAEKNIIEGPYEIAKNVSSRGDSQEWLSSLVYQSQNKYRLDRSADLCGMKYDGKYSSFKVFINSVILAFNNNDDMMLYVKISNLLAALYAEKDSISDYEEFLKIWNQLLKSTKNRVKFATLMKNNDLVSDMLEISIMEQLKTDIKKERLSKSHYFQISNSTTIEDWVVHFFESAVAFSSLDMADPSLDHAINQIFTIKTKTKKSKLFVNLYKRFSNPRLDLKHLLCCYIGLQVRIGKSTVYDEEYKAVQFE
eukprot:NODE_88_length_21789_cov_0.534440.p8 type:complete len:285 gc:universal NODE_88_length_21789_cov_0.534440:7762-8616(+)